jgi:hypothetical protein
VDRKKDPPHFRFLDSKEFVALSAGDRTLYLKQAVEAIKSGAPLDELPIKDFPGW